MGEPGFRGLRVEQTAADTTARRPADDERNAGVSAVAIGHGGGLIDDLVEAAGNEVHKLHFCDRPHAHQSCADGVADDCAFTDRRVTDALITKLVVEAVGYLEGTAVSADIFTENKDGIVLFHLCS